MKRTSLATQSRSRLDTRFRRIGPVNRFAPPTRGWIRALREGLGMSAAQLAKRLGMKQPSVVNLEQSEANGTIELSTLRRVGEALDCTLIYALVPNRPLGDTVRDRARSLAQQRLASVAHSMQLEDQGVSAKEAKAQLDDLVRNINPRRLWDDV